MVTLQDVQAAQARIRDAISPTPCPRSEHFEQAGVAALYCKLENLHRTGAFKERGALNTLLTLGREERARGVIAASAGNHAQGLAYHAGRLGIPATLVMPERTPLIKVTRTRSFGARVVLHGASYDEAYAEALRLQQAEGAVFVHPFNDERVIAGQGTIGLELLEQVPDLEVLVCPIGGGGLISGVATALKAHDPRIQVIGVQAANAPSMKASREAGRLVEHPVAVTVADGIAVKRPGDVTYAHIQRLVDDIVTVDEEEIANAILLLLEREKTVVEGAGAVGVAALIHGRVPQARGRRVATLLSGGNIDVTTLSRIIERGLAKDGRLVRLVVSVPDRPGSLARLTGAIAEQGANVVEIFHQRATKGVALGEAQVLATLETRGADHVQELRQALEKLGWQVSEQT